jgi:hypothetical protein
MARCRPTVIIADRGDRAWLLVTDGHLPLGARFVHHGLMWEIVGCRELSRALVAEPVHRKRAIS